MRWYNEARGRMLGFFACGVEPKDVQYFFNAEL